MIEFDSLEWWKDAKVLVRVATTLPRELFELDQQAVDAVAAGELPLVTTDLDKTE